MMLGVEGRRRRGSPRLRLEDCVKRDLAGVGEWRRLGETAVKRDH